MIRKYGWSNGLAGFIAGASWHLEGEISIDVYLGDHTVSSELIWGLRMTLP
jgi:hypothetical protein